MENEIKFPDYCCFGKRQSGQPVETADSVTAVYRMFGIRVHELSYDTTRSTWTLTEYAPDGRRTMLTCNTALDRAICNHMMHLDDQKNELLVLLRQKLQEFGPVWIAPLPSFNKGEKSIVYSPAGKLTVVRLLLSSCDEFRFHLTSLMTLYEYHNAESGLNLKLHRFYETSLVVNKTDGTSYWHLAFVAEFVVPLAFVFDTAKLFHDKGLISLNGLDRVMIFDAPQEAESRILEFGIAAIPGAESYLVILKGLAVSDETFANQRKDLEQKYQVESF